MFFKKSLLVTALLGSLSLCQAAAYDYNQNQSGCSSNSVSVPCEGDAWSFGADLLYAANSSNVLSNSATNLVRRGFTADYGLGFNVMGSYHFGTGHDFSVNFAHVSKSSTPVLTLNNTGGQNEDFESKYMVFNAELGHTLQMGEDVDVRFFGGLKYADLQNEADADTTDATPAEELKVEAFGPRAGLNVNYQLSNSFALFTDLGVSVLRMKQTMVGGATGGNGGDVQSGFIGVPGENKRMLAATDIRIGAKVNFDTSYGDVAIHAGWMMDYYHNAAQGIAANLAQSIAQSTNDLGWDSFFLGVKWTSSM